MFLSGILDGPETPKGIVLQRSIVPERDKYLMLVGVCHIRPVLKTIKDHKQFISFKYKPAFD